MVDITRRSMLMITAGATVAGCNLSDGEQAVKRIAPTKKASTTGGKPRKDGYTRTPRELELAKTSPINNSRIEDMKLFKRKSLDGATRLHFIESEFVGTFDTTIDHGGKLVIDNDPEATLYYLNNKEGDINFRPRPGSTQIKNAVLNRPKKGINSIAGNAVRVSGIELHNPKNIEQCAIIQGGFNQRLGLSTYDWMMLERGYMNGLTQKSTHFDGNNVDGIDLSTGCYPVSAQNTVVKNIGDAAFDLKASGVGRNNTIQSTSWPLRMHNKSNVGAKGIYTNENMYLKQIHANTIIDFTDWQTEYRHLLWFFNTNDDPHYGPLGQMVFYNCLFRMKDGTLAKSFTKQQATGSSWGSTIDGKTSLVSHNTNDFEGRVKPDPTLQFDDRIKFIETYDDYLVELDDFAVGVENSKLGSSPSGYDIIKDFSSDVFALEFEARDGAAGSWQRITPDSGLASGEEYIGAMCVDISKIDSETMQYRAVMTRRSTGQSVTIDKMVPTTF